MLLSLQKRDWHRLRAAQRAPCAFFFEHAPRALQAERVRAARELDVGELRGEADGTLLLIALQECKVTPICHVARQAAPALGIQESSRALCATEGIVRAACWQARLLEAPASVRSRPPVWTVHRGAHIRAGRTLRVALRTAGDGPQTAAVSGAHHAMCLFANI